MEMHSSCAESFASPLGSFASPPGSFASPLESFASPLESVASPLESVASPLDVIFDAFTDAPKYGNPPSQVAADANKDVVDDASFGTSVTRQCSEDTQSTAPSEVSEGSLTATSAEWILDCDAQACYECDMPSPQLEVRKTFIEIVEDSQSYGNGRPRFSSCPL
jgi:hypothetical protein